MQQEQWDRVQDVFLQALDFPPEEQTFFLDQVCADDPDLRKEVESLLNHDRPTAPLIASLSPVASAIQIEGRRIGPYRVVRLLGRGGMGAVYLAARDDDQFKKEVAIKLLNRGMDTDSMLERFRRERQILANLEHPFIARLIDGGATDDGLPYFVLEYVDGLPITKYCDEKRLSTAARLDVFRMVCEAVQYAHQNLVVHCDLKPGNILITKEGVPKLLDFGIAKVINPVQGDAQTVTMREQRLMTPDYASPEQVMGLPSSTSMDIYALGVVLYELLAGARPLSFTAASLAEIERTIRETEPPRPSAMASDTALAGDLDAIVLTAMHKDPLRRYASAAEFSEDIRRHKEGLPVTAQEDRWTYRANKFVRRHKVGVLAAALIAVSLVGGIAATTIQARRAERRFLLVRQLANSVVGDLSDKVRRLPGSVEVQMAMVQTVVKYLDALAEDAGSDPGLNMEIARAYSRVAGLEWPHLGQSDAARIHHLKALELVEKLADEPATRENALAFAVSSHVEVGVVLRSMGRPDEALRHLQKAASITEGARGKLPISVSTQVNLYTGLASTAWEHGDFRAEQAYGRQVVEISKRRAESGRASDVLDSMRAAYLALGDAYKHGGDFENALTAYEKAYQVATEIVQRSDASLIQQISMGSIHHVYGDLLGAPDDPNAGRRAEALDHYRQAARIHEALVASDPKDVNARRNLAGSYRRVGIILLESDPAKALAAYRKAAALSKQISEGDPKNVQYKSAYADGMLGEGSALHRLRRNNEAIPILRRAIEMQNFVENADPSRTSYLRTTSRTYVVLGNALLASGDAAAALEAYQAGLAAAERILARAPTSMYQILDRADAVEALGRFDLSQASKASPARRLELLADARHLFEDTLSTWRDWIKRGIATSYARTRERQMTEALTSLAVK